MWDHFKELCNLQFGPAVRGTHLSELARLPFTSTVQDYSERFNAVLYHVRNLFASQKAELFVGGLPEHIKVDVELREPQNLQTAMYLARAFERRATATTPATPQRGTRPPQRPGIPAPLRPAVAVPVAPGATTTQAPAGAAAPARPFRRLSPAEQLERRRQGLCYNCDEPYVRGHVCQRLFYLEAADFLDDDIPAEVAAVAAFPEEAAVPAPAPPAGQEPAAQPQVSLYAIAGIRTENAMLLLVSVHGHWLVALLDSGSTHNFINADLLRRLHLSIAPHPNMRVLVANSDRVPCEGVT